MSQKYSAKPSQSSRDLARELHRIDHKGYGAYKDLLGSWNLGSLTLFVDRVQPDPYAPPSRIRLRIPLKETGIPKELYNTPVRRIALEDLLARNFREVLSKRHGGNEKITLAAGGQEMLERTALRIASEAVEVRMNAEFPARGRTVLGRRGEELLVDLLPQVARESLSWSSLPQEKAWNWIKWAENRSALEEALKEAGVRGLRSQWEHTPPKERGLPGTPFPEGSGALRQPLLPGGGDSSAPHSRRGLRRGTPDTGDGPSRGNHPHRGGEGSTAKAPCWTPWPEESIPTFPGTAGSMWSPAPTAWLFEQEDGRPIGGTDISPFITNLPRQKDTVRFFTPNASGQHQPGRQHHGGSGGGKSAAASGRRQLRHQLHDPGSGYGTAHHLGGRTHHPLPPPGGGAPPDTPHLHPSGDGGMRGLLRFSGPGDYDEKLPSPGRYLPGPGRSPLREPPKRELFQKLKYPPSGFPNRQSCGFPPKNPTGRTPRGGRGSKIKSRGTDEISLNGEVMDLRRVEQLVDSGQTRAIGGLLKKVSLPWRAKLSRCRNCWTGWRSF